MCPAMRAAVTGGLAGEYERASTCTHVNLCICVHGMKCVTPSWLVCTLYTRVSVFSHTFAHGRPRVTVRRVSRVARAQATECSARPGQRGQSCVSSRSRARVLRVYLYVCDLYTSCSSIFSVLRHQTQFRDVLLRDPKAASRASPEPVQGTVL